MGRLLNTLYDGTLTNTYKALWWNTRTQEPQVDYIDAISVQCALRRFLRQRPYGQLYEIRLHVRGRDRFIRFA